MAALVATALCILTLHQLMNGTDRKPPPAPTSPATVPMTVPAASMPGALGSSRAGDGFLLRIIWVAEKATNRLNTSASRPVSSCWPIQGPIQEPSTIPGAMATTTGQRTAPCRWCARTEDSEVNRIVPSEVAMAMCTTLSGGKPWAANIMVTKGTSTMPPPTPSKPAAKPPPTPISSSRATIVHSIAPSRV